MSPSCALLDPWVVAVLLCASIWSAPGTAAAEISCPAAWEGALVSGLRGRIQTTADMDDATTPFLHNEVPRLVDAPCDPADRGWLQRYTQETPRLLRLAIPMSLGQTIGYAERMITVAQVGRLSPVELSAMSLAQTFFNITGLSLVYGMASALDTFCGQAYGASQPALLGVLLQRGLLLSCLTGLLPLVGWVWAHQELLLLGQPPQLAEPAANFIHVVSPSLLLDGATSGVMTFLGCQGLVTPVTLMTLLVTLVAPGVNQLFIYTLGWRLPGAAAGRVLLQVLRLLAQVAVVAWHNRRQPPAAKPWTGFAAEALQSWGAYMAVALPATAMMCLEWWVSEALTLLAGLMPDANTAVAATGICFGLNATAFMMVYGIGAAVSIRVSNELGAGHHKEARAAVFVAMGTAEALCLVIAAVLRLQPVFFARMFTSDPTVAATVVACIPWLSLSLVGNGAGSVISGALRGAGRQALGTWVNLAAYWGLGLPLSVYAGLTLRRGAEGLWMAMACTRAVQVLVLLLVLARLDWQQEVLRSELLVQSQSTSRAQSLRPSCTDL